MNDYTIFTDSGSDITKELCEKWNVKSVALSFYFDDDKENIYRDGTLSPKEFYDEMRKGRVVKTTGVNISDFNDAFRKELDEGKDILYIGFSSALSSTYHVGEMTAEELREEYPDRKIITLDSLSASAGQSMLIFRCVQKKAEGAGIEEVYEYAKENLKHQDHWFTVNDLMYLKRGGRLNPASAVLGTVLNIKPVLHTDNDGTLVSLSKVRGIDKAVEALADKYGKLALEPGKTPFYFCHSDCMDLVDKLNEKIKSTYGISVSLVFDIGAVIGAHVGPGTIGLFFEGKER